LIGIFGAADFGIKNFMAAIIHYSDTNKKRSSNFANLLVDGKITVREKGKRYIDYRNTPLAVKVGFTSFLCGNMLAKILRLC